MTEREQARRHLSSSASIMRSTVAGVSPSARSSRSSGGATRARAFLLALTVSAVVVVPPASPALGEPGDLDPTFGIGGWAFFEEDLGVEHYVNSMVIDSQDRIIVVGAVDDRFAVWRFHPDGVPDMAFGTDGGVVVSFVSRTSEAEEVALTGDGRIVAVGSVGRRVAAVRLLPTGDLDPDFGAGDGVATFRPATRAWSVARDVEVLSDGSTVVAGPILDLRTFGVRSFLLRLGADGEPDGAFGSSGLLVDQRECGTMTVDDRGVVLVVQASSSNRFAVVRFDLAGTPDESFGGDGDRSYCLFDEDRCRRYDLYPADDVVVDDAGNLVLAFAGWIPYRHRIDSFAVLRLTADGDRDTSFSRDGVRTFLGVILGAGPRALALQDDGRILMSGYVLAGGGSGENWPVVARLGTDGQLDPTFGDEGWIFLVQHESFWSNGNDIAIQSGHRIIVLIEVTYGTGFGLARLLAQ